MTTETNTNIPAMNVTRVVTSLSEMYIKALSAHLSPKLLPAVMMWGPPGVGKSQAVRQIAREIERGTGKRCVLTDVRLLLFNPIDLRGIPTANADKTLAVWLRPKLFDMDPDERVVNILFLDEISAAPPSVQAAAYQITLDRVVGEHKLPDNCIVIAAGNRITDRSVAFNMPKALANRLCHVEVEKNTDSWLDWAMGSGINKRVIGFLSFRTDYLMAFDPSGADLAFPTPRSWEMVSNVMNLYEPDFESAMPIVSGLVGVAVGAEFKSWCRIYSQLPSIEDIFAGRSCPLPKSPDAMYALISSMAVYAREHKDNLARIANSVRYAMAMPPDFSAVLMKYYMAIERGYRERLLTIPEFGTWLRTKGKFVNGAF